MTPRETTYIGLVGTKRLKNKKYNKTLIHINIKFKAKLSTKMSEFVRKYQGVINRHNNHKRASHIHTYKSEFIFKPRLLGTSNKLSDDIAISV